MLILRIRKMNVEQDEVYEGYMQKWVARPKIRLRSTFLEHIAFVFRVSPICKAAIYHSGAHSYELL